MRVRIFSLLAILLTIALFSCDQAPTTATNNCIYRGIDTCQYKILFQKDSNLILTVKAYDKATFSTEHINPETAVMMVKNHVQADVITGTLRNNFTKHVTFDISKLIDFYKDLVKAGRTPDSLRIYYGVYDQQTAPADHQDYAGKLSCVLVGTQLDNDIYAPTNKQTWPVNIGTLCPPGCNRTTAFGDQTKGSIYLKMGAARAGATNW